jgi:hypothetical protein
MAVQDRPARSLPQLGRKLEPPAPRVARAKKTRVPMGGRPSENHHQGDGREAGRERPRSHGSYVWTSGRRRRDSGGLAAARRQAGRFTGSIPSTEALDG